MNNDGRFAITWRDSGHEPRVPPNPAYPTGIDLDASQGAEQTCQTALPYPAQRIGSYFIECNRCGIRVACTTGGKPDDPRSIKMACHVRRPSK